MADALTDATSITIGGVKCWDEGTVEVAGRYQSTAERTVVCKWSDRQALRAFFLGGSSVVGGVTIYSAGQAYADTSLAIYCDKFTSKGVVGEGGLTTDDNGMVAYKYARNTISYSTIDFGFDGSAMNPDLIGVDYGVELVHARQSAPVLKFAGGDDLPSEDNPPIPVPLITYTVPIRNLPTLPKALLRSAADAPVNKTSCLNCAPGTLMFNGGKAVYGFRNGRIAWALDLTLIYKGCGWNTLLTSSGFQSVVRKSDGSPMLATSDLNLLLPYSAAALTRFLTGDPPLQLP